jgi:hypothetical protein
MQSIYHLYISTLNRGIDQGRRGREAQTDRILKLVVGSFRQHAVLWFPVRRCRSKSANSYSLPPFPGLSSYRDAGDWPSTTLIRNAQNVRHVFYATGQSWPQISAQIPLTLLVEYFGPFLSHDIVRVLRMVLTDVSNCWCHFSGGPFFLAGVVVTVEPTKVTPGFWREATAVFHVGRQVHVKTASYTHTREFR